MLSVTLDGQLAAMPKAWKLSPSVPVEVLPITVLPWPTTIPAIRLASTKLPVTIPVAEIPTPPLLATLANPTAVLPLTIPLASMPVPGEKQGQPPTTRNPSTIEPSAEESPTPLPKPEIDPFRTAMPCRLPEDDCAAIAVVLLKLNPILVV